MHSYSKLLAIILSVYPATSASMSSAVQISASRTDLVSATIAASFYGAFFVSHYVKQNHEMRNHALLSGQIDKETAKALMGTPPAQHLIKNLRADQAKRRQQFFYDNSRELPKDVLIKAGFTKMLHDKCLFDHASRIIGFLSLSETALDAQLLQLEKMQIDERAGLRHRIIDEATKKTRAEHAKHTKVTRSFFIAACTAGSTAYCSL